MQFPDWVHEIVEKATRKHPTDIPKAVTEAEKGLRKHSEFKGLVADLIRSAIEEQVYEVRHRITRRVKKEAGQYGGPAKVTSGSSPGVAAAAESVYNFCIAGTVLGQLLGRELRDIAESEDAIAEGHTFNARLCYRLDALVPLNKRVQDVVSERRLRAIFREIRGRPDSLAGD